MNEDRKRILGMLAEGKITADEADMLLDSIGAGTDPAQPVPHPVAFGGLAHRPLGLGHAEVHVRESR